MQSSQPGILADLPSHARYLTFSLLPGADPKPGLARLRKAVNGDASVVGLGQSLVLAAGGNIERLRTLQPEVGVGIDVPSTPAALLCWLRGDDRGELVHRTRRIEAMLADTFRLDHAIDAFMHRTNRDLTGYEDGTENPEGDDAVDAAIWQGAGDGLDGSSFMTVQQWVHDHSRFESMSPEKRDHTIGRRVSDNEEIDDAPESAHVKRTAQESFDPEAFMWRRSMPWADAHDSGLVFVAFGKSFDAFEVQMKRMVGADDGIPDALFRFTRPVTGCYFWCPPVNDGRLDLRAIGI